ncbi:MAG: hypothetical protein ACI80H_001332 [Pseudoalteromonas distincta]|jgi:hypothetical protein
MGKLNGICKIKTTELLRYVRVFDLYMAHQFNCRAIIRVELRLPKFWR